MSRTDARDDLFADYLLGALAPERAAELERRLRVDAGARRRLLAMAADEVLIRDVCGVEARIRATAPRRPARRPAPAAFQRAGWAAAAVVLAGVLAWLLPGLLRTPPVPPVAVARAASVEGLVDLVRPAPAGPSRTPLRPGDAVRAGDLLETKAGRAVVAYEGEPTRLSVRPRSSVRLEERDGAKRVRLDAGGLDAEVAAQPQGRPMVFATPHVEAVVLGTRFSLDATREETRLAVRQGGVRLVRAADGSETTVGAGRLAVARAGAPLAVSPLDAPPGSAPAPPPAPPTVRALVFDGNANDNARRLREDVRLDADVVARAPDALAGVGLLVLAGWESGTPPGDTGLAFFAYGGRERPLWIRDLVLRETGGREIAAWRPAAMEPFRLVTRGVRESLVREGALCPHFSLNCWDDRGTGEAALEDAPGGGRAIAVRNVEGQAVQFYTWGRFPLEDGRRYEIAFDYRSDADGAFDAAGAGHATVRVPLPSTRGAWATVRTALEVAVDPVPPESFKPVLSAFLDGGGTVCVPGLSGPLRDWLTAALGLPFEERPAGPAGRMARAGDPPLLRGVSDGDLALAAPPGPGAPFRIALPRGATALTDPPWIAVVPVGRGRLVIDRSVRPSAAWPPETGPAAAARAASARIQRVMLAGAGARLLDEPR